MKIYFCGSISGGRQDAAIYARHIEKLKKYGQVLTEHVGSTNENEAALKNISADEIHDRDMCWLESCDVVVAEVSQVSLGVGYEIGRAVAMKKRILCLFRPDDTDKKLSCMIRGLQNKQNAQVLDYNENQIDQIFEDFFCKS